MACTDIVTYFHVCICKKEREGSRMRQAQLGVLREDPQEDMRLLIENYTGIIIFKMPFFFSFKNVESRKFYTNDF